MHNKWIWRAWLLTALAVLAPGAARAEFGEDYAPPDPVWPFPLYSTHPEEGGLYTAGQFISYRQTNPLHSQVVAVRGLTIVDNTSVFPPRNTPFAVPTFLGSGAVALDVLGVAGHEDFQPGLAVTVGWKFSDGSAFEVKGMYIDEVNLRNSATSTPFGFNVGQDFSDSFLSSPVFGYPSAYGGPANKLPQDLVNSPVTIRDPRTGRSVNLPVGSSAPGIWNGASVMTEQFIQRTQEYEGTYRMPICENETYRMNALFGPRFVWFWERYKWRTTDEDVNGGTNPDFMADYVNIVSNRLYGFHVGCQQECYLGHGVAATLDLQGALLADSVKTNVNYMKPRGSLSPGSKHATHRWRLVPEAQATVGLMWYPIEGVQLHAGYDLEVFFNTVSTHEPIDFNFGAVDPKFESSTVRFLDGLDVGIAFIF